MANKTVVANGLLALLVAASPAHPDEPWRLFVGPSLFLPGFSTTYVTTYAPPFEYVTHTSTATQTMPLDASAGPGVLLGVERALGRHVGLQLSAHYGAAEPLGRAGRVRPQHAVHVPSAAVVRPGRGEPAALRGAAGGRRSAEDAGSGPRPRGLDGPRLLAARLGVSAGPAWLRTKGRAESLVYTSYFMGGHSTSFSEDYLVSFEFPSSTLGLDAGGFAEVDLGRRVGLRLDLRYCWGPERDADVTLREIVNAGRGHPERRPDRRSSAGLAPAPARVDPSFFRAALALTVRF